MSLSTRVLFVLLLIVAGPSRGQQKLGVGVTASPTFSHIRYTYRYFYPESDGQLVEPLYLNGARWLTGYSVGVSVLYTYAPGWSISSGVWFEQLSTQQDRQPAAGRGVITLHNRVIRLPISLTYYPAAKRLSPYFSLGFFIDLPITSRLIAQREGESTQYLRLKMPLSPVFHLTVGAGVRYQCSKRYTLLAQPIWAYTLGRFGGATLDDPSIELGLQSQFIYSF